MGRIPIFQFLFYFKLPIGSHFQSKVVPETRKTCRVAYSQENGFSPSWRVRLSWHLSPLFVTLSPGVGLVDINIQPNWFLAQYHFLPPSMISGFRGRKKRKERKQICHQTPEQGTPMVFSHHRSQQLLFALLLYSWFYSRGFQVTTIQLLTSFKENMQHFQFSFLQFGTLSNKTVLLQDCLILSFGVDFRSSSSFSFPRVTFMRSANISIESWHHEFRFIAHFPGLPADFFPGCRKGKKKWEYAPRLIFHSNARHESSWLKE